VLLERPRIETWLDERAVPQGRGCVVIATRRTHPSVVLDEPKTERSRRFASRLVTEAGSRVTFRFRQCSLVSS
jgi:hypothetical protein